ncbi:MAG: hypothetical protein IJT97_06590 [Bacteroidaceae bacterium]|nr:hypothetical protein [Bacteroidaceae bacterium]
MQRKILCSLWGICVCLLSYADVGDALKGIWPVTDPMLIQSLNGEWQLKVVNGIDDNKNVPPADASWGKIPVPGCWEAYGFCKPTYSFPDSLTGYYRTSFTVPAAWKGQSVILRLDGVLRGYDLWLNDQYVGTWEQSYNTCLFDLTPYLSKKAFKGELQQLALRVYSRYKGFEFDCFDDWTPMGIHRDVTLFPVPYIHLSDLTVTTRMSGEVRVETQIVHATKQTTVNYEIYDALGHLVSTDGLVPDPHLWTAETPYLYTLCVYLKEKGKTLQTFQQKIGIREVSIDGNVLKVNGKPIKLRGVTCHATDPVTVKVVSEELTRKDMRLMKEASVNYIRTSHYPREPRFYELADSLGFYVVDEAPMGSRGEKNLSKADYQDIMRTCVAATLPRDKNHPSVIVWSIGNENPLPKSCQALGEYAKTFDSTRPICYPQKGSYFRSVGFEKFPAVADVYAPHYPTTSQLRDYYTQTDRPLIFTEYCHTLGISFEDHDRQWEIIEQTPGIAGGSVWEWVDQGMPFTQKGGGSKWRADGSERDQRVFTTMDGGFEMKGNFGTDGLLYADRTPLPNYYELQHNYARAFVSDVSGNQLGIVNRFDFLNLKDNVTFHWALTNNRDTVARGAFSPDCAPRSTATYSLPLPPQTGLALLHFDITDAQGHRFLQQSFVLQKPALEWAGTGNVMDMIQDSPLVRTGRKATMAERITQKGRLPKKYLLPLGNTQVKAEVQGKPVEGGQEVSFTLLPDTADVFRAELGLAYLLDKSIDRVQWLGYGPFASYPGRKQANRYGFWAKHQDDLYFEGNHGGVDAALFSDKDGNGVLVVGDSLSLNFEQTDRGIVMTVNAAVSGQGPKFAKTAFNGWKAEKGTVGATFRIYRIDADKMPLNLRNFFVPANTVPAPFHPFETQYDTYLLRYADIVGE